MCVTSKRAFDTEGLVKVKVKLRFSAPSTGSQK